MVMSSGIRVRCFGLMVTCIALYRSYPAAPSVVLVGILARDVSSLIYDTSLVSSFGESKVGVLSLSPALYRVVAEGDRSAGGKVRPPSSKLQCVVILMRWVMVSL